MVNSSDKNKFAIAKKNIIVSKEVVVRKDEVGIIESEARNYFSIFFIKPWKYVKLEKDDFKIINVDKTGDGFSKKICNVCHKLKNTSEFAKNQNAKNNRSVRRPSCGRCRKEIEGIKVSRADRLKWLKKKPLNEPFECPICKKKTIAGITSKIVLEHDHNTGKVRGWICDSCNTGLGRFRDDIELLKNAIKFLRKNY